MKYKIAFVIPYFGKFKNYFELFLESCRFNPDYTWLIFTDNKIKYDYPPNVIVHYCKFADLVKYVQNKFSFNASLNYPYKFCDYKPAYGYIFQNYLKSFDFWGYCDTDLIWGKLSDYITDDILQSYDKIGVLGHCTIIRNSDKYNMAFTDKINGKYVYREVFKSRKKVRIAFDEEYNDSINNIFINNGFKIFKDLKLAGIYTKSSDFRLVNLLSNNNYFVEKKSKSFFVWSEGKLFRYRMMNNDIKKEEYAYIHLQSRPMKIRMKDKKHFYCYKIIPNSFDDLETTAINKRNFYKIKKKHFNLHYFILRTHNLIKKTKNLIQEN